MSALQDEAVDGASIAAISGPSTAAIADSSTAVATTPPLAEEVRKQLVIRKVGRDGIDCQGCRAVGRKVKEFQ